MRFMPFVKGRKGFQMAGGGVSDSGGGGGGSYVLPVATSDTLGGVKIGSGINVTSDGTISASGGGGGSLPDYSETEFDTGRKWIDGKTIYGIVKSYTTPRNFSANSYNDTSVYLNFNYAIKNCSLYSSDLYLNGIAAGLSSTEVRIKPFTDFSSATAIYVEYTK